MIYSPRAEPEGSARGKYITYPRGQINKNLFVSWLGFLCSVRGIYYINLHFCQLSEKLRAALIVTGESGAEKNS